MKFINKQHEERYLQLMTMETQYPQRALANYNRMLIYVIAGNDKMFSQVEGLFDFKFFTMRREFIFEGTEDDNFFVQLVRQLYINKNMSKDIILDAMFTLNSHDSMLFIEAMNIRVEEYI